MLLVRTFIVVLSICILKVRCSRENIQLGYKNNVERKNVTAIDLLDGLQAASSVVLKKQQWHWKPTSNYLHVADGPSQQILTGLHQSFSVEFQLKLNRRSKASVFRVVAYRDGQKEDSWMEIVLHPKRTAVQILFKDRAGDADKISISWQGLQPKTWLQFMLHIDESSATVSFTSKHEVEQLIPLANGIHLPFPQNVKFELGGNSRNVRTRFVGAIRKGMLYLPAILADMSQSSDNSILKKRGASRKPGLPAATHILSDQGTAHSRGTFLNTADGQINSLQRVVQACQDESAGVKRMVDMLKQTVSELQGRVKQLESCECVRRCVGSNGSYYSNGATWVENFCTTCVCHHGEPRCRNDTACFQDMAHPCNSSPCLNNGVCQENNDGFICRCPSGFEGDLCQLADPCSTVQCQNGGICVSRDSVAVCNCRSGFLGDRCQLIDWCRRSSCLNGGTCTNFAYRRECQCQSGFVGSSCQYRDLCLTSPCRNNGRCIMTFVNNVADYSCECRDGYRGKQCEDVDSCASNPCMNAGICTNSGVSFVCRCTSGFSGDVCDVRDACYTEPCMNGGRCVSQGTGFDCECGPGYQGKLCESYDSCTSAPCINGGRCLPDDVTGRYTCQCPSTHTGKNCEKLNYCASQPCLNGGVCELSATSFVCRCRRTHYGDRCEYNNYCRAMPCMNGATCTNDPLNDLQPFTCECLDGYVGTMCENRDLCRSNPCLNGGTCSMRGTNYQCICGELYTGQRCEMLDYCSRTPCLNGGVCHNMGRGFRCDCPTTHIGGRCENPHPCRNNPCLNGGVCSLTGDNGGYSCSCPPTHYGTECELRNPCHQNPCLNGGTCEISEQGHVCSCPPGYYGANCGETDRCSDNPCLNGGVCQNTNGTVTCNCPESHRGSRCQFMCNICLYLSDRGTTCPSGRDVTSGPLDRWYYDKYSQTCKPLHYAGCGGNKNNFGSRQACRQRCIVGTCCLARMDVDGQMFVCRRRSMGQCKRINNGRKELQVVGFHPGQTCAESQCAAMTTCQFGGVEYTVGSQIAGECGAVCTCTADGVMNCPCTDASVRKEIRRMTSSELSGFQDAVRSLKMTELDGGGSVWDSMRDEYMYRAPIAQSRIYFLLWNRAFVRKMEMLLQTVGCQVTIPYFDFTTDAGSFGDAVAWQPNYFGGDGRCVPDHPFRVFMKNRATAWEPCLVRHFNASVSIPSMVDVAIATSVPTLEELSSNLLQITSYVKAYIGGDMSSAGCAYDPVFYSIHAYIDYLFAQWQEKHPDVRTYPDMSKIPTGLSADLIWNGACASYVDMNYDQPCNVSSTSTTLFGSDGFNLQGFNADGFDRRGYDRDGYDVRGRDRFGRPDSRAVYVYNGYSAEGYNRSGCDRRGFNRFGYKSDYNRDGYDSQGYNRQGFDRYELDSLGFDTRGYDIYGVSKYGQHDRSEFYDSETSFSDCCFSRDGFTVSGLDRYGFTAAGYNQHYCNYFFNGPHALYYQNKLWEILSVQPSHFLTTLQRTCTPLSALPTSYLEQSWITKARPALTPATESNDNSTFSQRFCFNIDVLMTWCPCLEGNYPAKCQFNPCENNPCPLHPSAQCRINFCGGSCSAEFYLQGRRVNCDDPCASSPCLNGGSCNPSRYSSASERYECQCLSGYTGLLCERQTADTCSLPKLVGLCQGQVRRWYFNQILGRCESFVYSGCGGNMNNFPNKEACDLRCSVGACCYRTMANTSNLIGFDQFGYDKYGFNPDGFNRDGRGHTPLNSIRFGQQVLAPKGHGHDGYNLYGYNEQGFDRQGYDRDGYHRDTGFNRTGYNRQGQYDQLSGYDEDGYDDNGLDRSGFGCNGVNSGGFNQLGFYDGFVYECRSLSVSDCDAISDPYEVVAFSPGKSCDEVQCKSKCGCDFNGKSYQFGESFQYACQTCLCTLAGTMECLCQRLGKRKEIRDLTDGERSVYQQAIRQVYESGEWDYFVSVHSQYMKLANSGPASLPWHRYFLTTVEREMKKHAGCDVSIPYYDWTVDVGSLNGSMIWSAAYFGGNGESETSCVKHHPFDGREPWSPCIRRNFSDSISLPNAVDFNLLLHEPNYEKFRLQLESMSALFHIWVGGHMASPFSPYDPVFLSHRAFIDLMWVEWQKKNPMGMPRFPIAHRYVQLEPFDVTPDDVLSSQQQSCVNYIPLTIGSPCNRTSARPRLVRNEDGFDRHGFDENGFDLEGFNANGRNRYGQVDERNIYRDDGFTDDGYSRSGYDTQGWDQFGFDQSNFDRDGVDIEGYDRTGYNQFGFDRDGKTPFGMYKNGRFAQGADAGYAASLFDKFGYNRFSYNKFGVDYNGYNAYGYNVLGYDRDKCNSFLHGPHHLRSFYSVMMQMRHLSFEALRHIRRICKPISMLPDWVAQRWLGNADRVHTYQEEWSRRHSFDESWRPRESSVTDDKLFLPITPDQQFCFDIQWHDGCPLGTPLMECPHDSCMDSRCASHPRAQCRNKNCGACYPEFYNGTTGESLVCFGCIDRSGRIYAESSTWDANCSSCVCQGGMIACMRMPCPTPSCTHPYLRPGQCCATCRDCEFNDRMYRSGQQFRNGECEICRCSRGSVTCQPTVTNCPDVACPNPVRKPGSCCPSCPVGCDGHSEGERWDMEGCRVCTCVNRKIECTRKVCPRSPCTHPHTPPSSCCSECRACQYEGRMLRNGQTFKSDCTLCTCSFGNVNCVSEQCPPLHCINQIQAPGSCCPVCRPGCEYEGNFYENGASFHPSVSPCRNCTCQNNQVECRGTSCLTSGECPRPVRKAGSCCPQCSGCRYGDQFYRNYQAWTSRDGCERCACKDGNIECAPVVPCRSTCPHGVVIPGHCCRDCSKCSYNSKIYMDGQSFRIEGNSCHRCTCRSGEVTCDVERCPSLSCESQERRPGECCPTCRSCNQGAIERRHGSSWRLKNDPCTACACSEGIITCNTERCRPISCEHPIEQPNSCCQVCDGCFYQGVEYANGDDVTSGDTCESCSCEAGSVVCRKKQCKDLSCTSQITVPGQCCPKCSSCSYDGRSYDEGTVFTSSRHPCLQCSCEDGETSCRRIDRECSKLPCTHAGRQRGECCRSCNSCEYERRSYRNGTTFNPPGSSPCLTCTCTEGSVACQTTPCEAITCQNPVVNPDQCCPTCTVCEVDGDTYQSGDSWFPDSCTSCTCNSGSVRCQANNCPDLPCSHPAKTPGRCCPSCDMCDFNSKTVTSGKSFQHPERPCQSCQCQSGSVSCSTTPCPAVSCDNPMLHPGACCPVCSGCRLSDELTISDGQTHSHPRDDCLICMCANGELDCKIRCTKPALCSHPSNGRCCRDNCDGCSYRGQDYENGATFLHHRNRCKSCTCTNGNVRCLRTRCPPPDCSNARSVPGQCCPSCPEKPRTCDYKGETLQSGEDYSDGCKVCRCDSGNVLCRAKTCPPTSCSHPLLVGCCRTCAGCSVGGKEYGSGQVVPGYSNDRCQTCRCLLGSVECSVRSCPVTSCSHPSSDGCCQTCGDCFYEGTTVSNSATFPSVSDECDECVCRNGNVMCGRRSCEDSVCTHPVVISTSCCPVCNGGCTFNGQVYEDGAMFNEPGNHCTRCRCSAGSVTCRAKQCVEANCRNPVVDACKCSVCDGCSHNGVQRANRERFANPANQRCSECFCRDGSVVCDNRHCPSSTCTHPGVDVCGCPLCNMCEYQGRTYQAGEEFEQPDNSCGFCLCQDGNVVCQSRKCADVDCINPSLDGCGCPTCANCNYLGVEYQDNERFIDTMNKCNQCVCRSGTIHCTLVACIPALCANPATPIGECCPKCIGTCEGNGESYENGAVFVLSSDSCSTCTCSYGTINCVKQRCGRSCSHPLSRSDCCPDCSGCLYQGRRFDDGASFSPLSDNCQQCSCARGDVICRVQRCPPTNCPNPQALPGECCLQCPQALTTGCGVRGQLREPGQRWLAREEDVCRECVCSQDGLVKCLTVPCYIECTHPVLSLDECCPTCDRCFYANKTYEDGQRFHPNSCQSCMCNAGSVHCITKACRPLQCPTDKQVQVEESCCPVCASCSMDGNQYSEGQTWTTADPCVTCHCHQGIVTCRPVTCIASCQLTTNVPGKCCPVCRGCTYNNQRHNVGETFEPNPMNPCEICECTDVIDGLPALSCRERSCPSLADCPRACVRQPKPGTCCPYCADDPVCNYGDCNPAIQGQQVVPSADQCFSCVCNVNSTWICLPRICPKLDCPTHEHYTPKGGCCPICDTCHIAEENKNVPSGSTWKVGECRACRCEQGSILCTEQQCQALPCARGMLPYKQAGQCCEDCVDPNQGCQYDGHTVASRSRWLVDKCTTCHCFAGKVECVTQQCRMLMCDADQVATVTPGDCCPQCIARPANCIGFGDPHFRTFDGRMVHFQGVCRYLFTADCMDGDFRVEVENSDRAGSFGSVSWIDKVMVSVAKHKIVLDAQYGISINGTVIPQLPFLLKPHVFIDRSGNHILINTHLGVHVTWNALQRHLEVNVPSSYKRRTCGLCGNFNNHPQDDLRLRNGRITNSDTSFGNNWKVLTRSSPPCPDATDINPCDGVPYSKRKRANTVCKVLRSDLFSACHQVLSPEMYFASCVHDVCACGENDPSCMCDVIEAYAAQCRRSGAPVRWRSVGLCAIACSSERGYVFDECGSPCKRTCANRNLPPGYIEEQCFMPCVSGCQCPAGYVEYQGRCINANDCPDTIVSITSLPAV